MFLLQQLARFCASAGVSHWAALHHVMGYLHSNPSFKLVYLRGNCNGLDGFADSDWGNSESRRSTTGLARYNKSIVLWQSRMQKTIVLSTAEAEYYSASEIAVEIIYLRNLIRNMGLPQVHRRMIPPCMRMIIMIPHASHGEITSLVVVNVPSISISASTLHIKSSRTATCDSSGF